MALSLAYENVHDVVDHFIDSVAIIVHRSENEKSFFELIEWKDLSIVEKCQPL